MFCPSRLKKRVNEWSSKKYNGKFISILLRPVNWRFLGQFYCLTCLFSLPLFSLLVNTQLPLDWLLLPITLIIAHGTAILFLPVAIHTPLIIGFLYGIETKIFQETIQAGWLEAEKILPSVNQLTTGISIGMLLLGISITLLYVLVRWQNLSAARIVFVTGNSVSTLIGAWISTQSAIFTFFISLFVGIFSISYRNEIKTDDDVFSVASSTISTVAVVVSLIIASTVSIIASAVAGTVAGTVAFIIAVTIGLGVASIIAVGISGIFANVFTGTIGGIVGDVVAGLIVSVVVSIVMGVVASVIVVISKTTILPFLAITAILSFSLSCSQLRWVGLYVSAILVALGFENLGWDVLWALPVTFSFYYRLLPEYILFTIIPMTLKLNFFGHTPIQSLSPQDIEQRLNQLPPFSSEILWLPLPGHAQLLARVFQHNWTFGLLSLKKMQRSALPGLPQTVKDALPDIVADQLLKFENIGEFESLESEPEHFHTHPILQTLLPRYFDVTSSPNQIDYPISDDLSNIFPRMQRIAEDVTSALKSENLTLRERGLERVLEKLNLLPSQLPSLGLQANDTKRWQPVISRWHNLIEIELSKKQKLSRGELRNPFQYGNPLQRSQVNLFKGRQAFADNIVRLLLDHNRPTIVLHGPRRCGKTSFLNNLPRLLPSDWVPIYVDMQSAAATADEISFLRTLARSIRRDGRSQGIQILNEPDRDSLQAAPYDTFETWLEAVLTELGPRQLLLNLDEFEKIGAAIYQGKLSLTLFDELRSLIQHWPQLGFVFSGVQTLEEIGPNWSSYFISVVPIEMLYLNPHEAQELLTGPEPDFALTYVPGLVDEILQLTQCHPNLLQLIGAALVTEANERQTSTATTAMLEAAIPRAFTLGTSYFTNIWDEFTGTLNNFNEIRAGQTILKALAEGQSLPSNPNPTARAALRRMVRYHVLKVEGGHYDFEIPLIKRWVQERAIIDE
jgi:hypothetical protein